MAMEVEGADTNTMELDGGAAGSDRATGGVSGGGTSAGEADRLSALPDRLLHAIMSFLKARQAVQTCVLATRWRHLWRSVPCLDVDYTEFRAVRKPPSNNNPADAIAIEFVVDDSDGSDEWDNFEDFADSLMHHCNIAMLDSLRLHVDSLRLRVSKSRAPSFASRQAGRWLRRAMKYRTPDPPCHPQLEGSRSTNAWRLKRLYICSVALDGRFRDHVRRACPSLEDLELQDCWCKIEAITSNSLKSLVLRNCRWRFLFQIISPTLKSLAIAGGSNSPDFVLYIWAPAIAHLRLDVPLDFAKRVVVN